MINLRTVSVTQLQPAPYNPRVPLEPGSPAYRRLERSLREFSLVQPIVWNEQTGHIVAGHQRLEILKRQGVQEIDVAVVSLPLEREKALNVTLNNSLVGSDWDPTKLMDLVGELSELPDFDETLTGFDEADIRALIMTPTPDFAAEQTDDANKDQLVRVSIDISPDYWESVRPNLDQLLAQHNLRAHIRLPN